MRRISGIYFYWNMELAKKIVKSQPRVEFLEGRLTVELLRISINYEGKEEE